MAYTRPFITRRFIAYGGESFGGDTHRHRLALAVQVLDEFTGKPVEVPLGVCLKKIEVDKDTGKPIEVLLRDPWKDFGHLRAIRNQSEWFCFEDVEAGDYWLVIAPDSVTADWFFLQLPEGGLRQDVFALPVQVVPPVPRPPSPWPRQEVRLMPKASYPFPFNATLVRGNVTTGAGNSPPGAVGVTISCTYKQVHPTDNDGTVTKELKTQTDSAGEYVLFFQKLPEKKQTVTVVAVKGEEQKPLPNIEIIEGVTKKADPIHFP